MQLFSCHVVTRPRFDGLILESNGAHRTGAAGDFVPNDEPLIVTDCPCPIVPEYEETVGAAKECPHNNATIDKARRRRFTGCPP